MAEITIRITPHADAHPSDIAHWIATGVALERDDEQDEPTDKQHMTEPLGLATAAEQESRTLPTAQVKRKGGRKSVAEKTAERLAAEQQPGAQELTQAVQQEVADQHTAPAQEQQPATTAGMTLPPGISMSHAPQPTAPALQPAAPAPQPAAPAPQIVSPAPTPIPAAMPHVPAAAPLANGAAPHWSLEDFRAMCMASLQAKPGKMSLLFMKTQWPDGTPKANVYTIEAVPEVDRQRYYEESMHF